MIGAYSCPKTPCQLLLFVSARMLYIVHVECIACFTELNAVAVGAIKVGLNLNVGSLAHLMFPTRQQVSP